MPDNQYEFDTDIIPQEPETYNFVDSYDQWIGHLKSVTAEQMENYKVLSDGNIVEHFKTARGFMTGPVGMLNGDVFEAKTRNFSTIDDLKEHINVENVYIYMLVDKSGRKIKRSHQEEATKIMLAQQAPIPEEMYEDVVEYAIRYSDI